MFTDHPVIDFMPDQRDMEDKGGTMRLGLYPAKLTPGSKAAAVYGQEVIYERHRHRFEVNNRYRQTLEAAGMLLSGQSPDGRLVEIVELQATTRGSWPASSTPSSSHGPSGRIRCSTGSSPRRSPSATGANRSSRHTSDRAGGRRGRAPRHRWRSHSPTSAPRRRRDATAGSVELPPIPAAGAAPDEDLPGHRRHRRDPDGRPLGRPRRRHHEPDPLRQGRRLVRRDPQAGLQDHARTGLGRVRLRRRGRHARGGPSLRDARSEHRGQGGDVGERPRSDLPLRRGRDQDQLHA